MQQKTATTGQSGYDMLLLFIEPFITTSSISYSLGMLSIATFLKHNNISVKYLNYVSLADFEFSEKEALFKDYAPKIIGFSLNSDNYFNNLNVIKTLKKWLPETVILAGGPLVCIQKEKILQEPLFDLAIYGEGEYPSLELCRTIINGTENFASIDGLIYRQNGLITVNKRREEIKNLDELPPVDYSLTHTGSEVAYSSGRGCPFACSFCSKIHSKSYRYLSSERVVTDILNLVTKHGASYIKIVDDTFLANTQRTIEICSRLTEIRNELHLDFGFFCESRADTICRHPQLIPILKKAGLKRIQIGIETGNQEILDIYNKQTTLSQIEESIKITAQDPPVNIVGNIILGGPFETEKTFGKTADFVEKLMEYAPGMFEPVLNYLCPYPGTDIGENPQKYGLTICDREWVKAATTLTPSCRSEELDEKSISFMLKELKNRIEIRAIKLSAAVPYETVMNCISSGIKYGIRNIYYSIFTSSRAILQYFTYKQRRGFKRFSEIKQNELAGFTPVRTEPDLKYTGDGTGFLLDTYLKPVIIKDNIEMEIYALSAGKLTVDEIARRLSARFALTYENILTEILPEFYSKLEKSFHIIFTK